MASSVGFSSVFLLLLSALVLSGGATRPVVESSKKARNSHQNTTYYTLALILPNLPASAYPNNPYAESYFLQKDLHAGTTLKPYMAESTTGIKYLPSNLANSIPFSSDKLAYLLEMFSINPGSSEARNINSTLTVCDNFKWMENATCATSWDAMKSFASRHMPKVEPIMKTIPPVVASKRRQYTITEVKPVQGRESVTCHAMLYVYKVFYCHATTFIDIYKVSLLGKDGFKATVGAVCHRDTAKWNPRSLGLTALGLKPGAPVCHFLLADDIAWVKPTE